MRPKGIWLSIGALPVVLALAAIAWANRHAEIPPADPPEPGAFDTALLRDGEALAGMGACAVCHTAEGGEPFAGGLPLPTPFGVIYSTNITPDAETGIGRWSETAFRRAMREGVDRRGRHLYPAFPYDHFTRMTDEDIRAVYAFLMTLDPVAVEASANELSFPFNIRMLLAGWKLLFLESGVQPSDPARGEEWNRGAYLAEGVGHCGACHSPRNAFGAVRRNAAYAGGEAEDWHVPALNASSPTPVPWTQLSLVNYLFDGWDAEHGIAAGPMAPVVNHLYDQSEDDIFSIAAYFESLQRPELTDAERDSLLTRARSLDWDASTGASEAVVPSDPALQRGMKVFRNQCLHCHKRGGEQLPVSLALTGTVNAPDPRNVIHIVFDGIRAPRGALQRSMPSFGISISDEEMVDLLKYVRWHYTDHPPWEGLARHVERKRAHW